MTLDFNVGDTVAVHQKIAEGEKTRIQIFEGVVLKIDRNAKSFTVRKISDGIGVELYYLRGRTARASARVVA